MSYADFDDIYSICCDWRSERMNEDELIAGRGKLFSDAEIRARMSELNRWWEEAEKEIYAEKEKVLI